MSTLVTGASGFIGRALIRTLIRLDLPVIGTVRRLAPGMPTQGAVRFMEVDFNRIESVEAWYPRLDSVEAVINAVGIFRETRDQTFDRVHALSPQALFSACASAGVRRVIQVSALGADEDAQSDFHRSKRDADAYLLSLPLSSTVVLPSLVYGQESESSQLFRLLAALPLVPLPGTGNQRVQPIHIHDLVEAIVALLHVDQRGRVPLVGPTPLTLREYLTTLRADMGLAPARFLPVPMPVLRGASRFGGKYVGLPDDATLGMLERGNTADVEPLRQLLGYCPRPASEFIPAWQAESLRIAASTAWLATLLRLSVAAVWLVTGVLSFGVYPVEASYALLARTGAPDAWFPMLLYGGAALDIVFGLGTLFLRRRPVLWTAQIALILSYTAIISVSLPEFWLHPFGPILKNLPMLAGIALLWSLDRR